MQREQARHTNAEAAPQHPPPPSSSLTSSSPYGSGSGAAPQTQLSSPAGTLGSPMTLRPRTTAAAPLKS